VLAEPRRQELVRLLEHEQLTQGQLVSRLGLSQPLLSHHLKVLREAGLVERTTCERVHVYGCARPR
jgi:ArsR family transcriptional regulator